MLHIDVQHGVFCHQFKSVDDDDGTNWHVMLSTLEITF